MRPCASCGYANPDGAKFCSECGTKLATTYVREERKLVTVLFCDLVGFTQRSDRADPEDVRALVRPFHDLLRAETERFGGTLARIVGDAGMIVFGYPVAHEDDPERAVRAALSIHDGLVRLNAGQPGLDLHARVGINTAEAIVTYGSALEDADDLMGDGVNLAARLQALAPADGIIVGAATHQAIDHLISCEELEPVEVKGKLEPVQAFRVLGARARTARAGPEVTPLVGRDSELAVLVAAFERTRSGPVVDLVSIIAEPGMGKSRLVREVARHVESLPEPVQWRTGRCLPFGDGTVMWALGEIVKAHGGILESDDQPTVSAKLDAMLTGVDAELAPWLKDRVGPLVGLDVRDAPPGREEAFAAWRAVVEHIAGSGPTVLVVEDVHWADEQLIAFLEHLATNAAVLPLLVLVTARPEVEERHPGWLAGPGGRSVVRLGALADDQVRTLVATALEGLAPSLVDRVVERAGGSPLYAEQLGAMLRDRSVTDGEAPFDEGAIPQSVQALLAARIDALPADLKALLLDASVLGKTIWSGALVIPGRREAPQVHGMLAELERRRFVRSAHPSSMAGDEEHRFWHALTRDVAYGTLPRARRAERHAAFARWLETRAPDRLEEFRQILAHHLATAYELAAASPGAEGLDDLKRAAVRALLAAGSTGGSAMPERAMAHLERARGMIDEKDPDYPAILGETGHVSDLLGDLPRARSELEEALRIYRERSDIHGAARVVRWLSQVMFAEGDGRASDLVAGAVAELERVPPSTELAEALELLGSSLMERARYREALVSLDRGRDVSRLLGREESLYARAIRGVVECELGNAEGLAALRAVVREDLATGRGGHASVTLANLGWMTWGFGGPVAAVSVFREGALTGDRYGLPRTAMMSREAEIEARVDAGELAQALEAAAALEVAGVVDSVPLLLGLRGSVAIALSLTGRADALPPVVDWLRATARTSTYLQWGLGGLVGAAMGCVAMGDRSGAGELLADAVGLEGIEEMAYCRLYLPKVVRAAVACGRAELVGDLVGRVEPVHPYAAASVVTARALLAEHDGGAEAAAAGFLEAAGQWDALGVAPEHGFALLGFARCVAPGGGRDPVAHLARAREIFERCGMAPAIAETDAIRVT